MRPILSHQSNKLLKFSLRIRLNKSSHTKFSFKSYLPIYLPSYAQIIFTSFSTPLLALFHQYCKCNHQHISSDCRHEVYKCWIICSLLEYHQSKRFHNNCVKIINQWRTNFCLQFDKHSYFVAKNSVWDFDLILKHFSLICIFDQFI